MRVCVGLIIFGVSILAIMSGHVNALSDIHGSRQEIPSSVPTIFPSGPTPSRAPTVFYQNGGPFVTLPLMCPKDIPLREGLSWRSITVGRSYLWDLDELYGVYSTPIQPIELSFFPGSFADIYRITLTSRASMDRRLATGVEACVVNWKIAALAITLINDSDLSPKMEDWIAHFGIPDVVTWSHGEEWRYRDLLWSKAGLALKVDTATLHDRWVSVNLVVFFPPVRSAGELSTSWPYTQLRRTPPKGINEGYPEEANPFNFRAILATVTAQPPTTLAPPATP